jgi:hypothetical protein
MPRTSHLTDTYRFKGFTPKPTVQGIFGDPFARVITLTRRQKKRHAVLAAFLINAFMTESTDVHGISPAVAFAFIWTSRCDESIVGDAAR